MLIYSTCSILREENDDVVDRFALQHADAHTEPLAVNWGLATARGRQLLPVAAGHDGFFYAALRKS
jgi:16S rRNA (cytosine967-C5)-methyltransferase